MWEKPPQKIAKIFTKCLSRYHQGNFKYGVGLVTGLNNIFRAGVCQPSENPVLPSPFIYQVAIVTTKDNMVTMVPVRLSVATKC